MMRPNADHNSKSGQLRQRLMTHEIKGLDTTKSGCFAPNCMCDEHYSQ